MAIEVSDRAVDEIKRVRGKEGGNAGGLRVGIKGGGCSGLSYNLGFESETRKSDKVWGDDKLSFKKPVRQIRRVT